MADDTIEIEYQLTVDDYAKFSADFLMTPERRSEHMRSFLKVILFYICLIETICLLGFWSEFTNENVSLNQIFVYHWDYWFSAKPLIPLIAIVVVYWLCYSKRRVRRRYMTCMQREYGRGQNISLLALSTITLSEEGFKVVSPYHHSFFSWKGAEGVGLYGGDLGLVISAVSYLCIPSRFFETEEETQRIYEQCVAWHKAAQDTDEDSKEVTA